MSQDNNNNKVTFTLGTDPAIYTLAFDFNAICAAETATGENLMRALSGYGSTASEMRALLFALLKPEFPKVTLDEAGELLTKDFPKVIRSITKAMTAGKLREEAGEPETAPETAPEAKETEAVAA